MMGIIWCNKKGVAEEVENFVWDVLWLKRLLVIYVDYLVGGRNRSLESRGELGYKRVICIYFYFIILFYGINVV